MAFHGFLHIVPRPFNGTAEHHAEDHPEDLQRVTGHRNVALRNKPQSFHNFVFWLFKISQS